MTWKGVSKGDMVALGDSLYRVVKVKEHDEKHLKVTVADTDGDEFTSKVRRKDPVEVVEAYLRTEKKWSEPDDKAEKKVVEILGGEVIGVKASADEIYVCPEVDADTVAAHLLTFHLSAYNPEMDAEAMLDLHFALHHGTGIAGDIEHRHDRYRPDTTKGPRFQ